MSEILTELSPDNLSSTLEKCYDSTRAPGIRFLNSLYFASFNRICSRFQE